MIQPLNIPYMVVNILSEEYTRKHRAAISAADQCPQGTPATPALRPERKSMQSLFRARSGSSNGPRLAFQVQVDGDRGTFETQLEGKWLQKSLREAILKPFLEGYKKQRPGKNIRIVSLEVNGREIELTASKGSGFLAPAKTFVDEADGGIVSVKLTLVQQVARVDLSGERFEVSIAGDWCANAAVNAKWLEKPVKVSLVKPFLAAHGSRPGAVAYSPCACLGRPCSCASRPWSGHHTADEPTCSHHIISPQPTPELVASPFTPSRARPLAVPEFRSSDVVSITIGSMDNSMPTVTIDGLGELVRTLDGPTKLLVRPGGARIQLQMAAPADGGRLPRGRSPTGARQRISLGSSRTESGSSLLGDTDDSVDLDNLEPTFI